MILRIAAVVFVVCLSRATDCLAQTDLRDPSSYSLGTQERRSEVTSDLGVFSFKWSRASERHFGKNPERALAEAAQTVRRALVQSSFPTELRSFTQRWSVVMLDEALAQQNLSGTLASNCHPGWMVPPNSIYLVAERAAQYCGGKEVPTSLADRRLAQILIHEIGHALEFRLMDGARGFNDRMRAEGFAAWFEQYASNFSSFIPRGAVRSEYRRMLAPETLLPTWRFTGSGSDYARAALYFELLERRRGIAGVMELYVGSAATGGQAFWDGYRKVVGASERELGEALSQLAKQN